MDPYLEARWSDVHGTLITLAKEALQPHLPAGLRARSEERVLLETVEQHTAIASYRGDVAVVQSPRGTKTAGASAVTPSSPVAAVEPFLVDYYEGPEVDRFLQIVDTRSRNRVITAVEILSPWNKGPGRLNRDYRRKLDDYARGEVSVVEIDLLRSGRGRLPVGQVDMPPERRTPYLVCVRRGWRASRWELYPVSLRAPLPRIPVPLREGEPDVALDLQPLIERAYAAGGHDDIDYSKPANPPLNPDDAAWAATLARDAR